VYERGDDFISGHLDASLSERWIGVDTHAHWKFVHEFYECVRGLYPDLVVADQQTGSFTMGAASLRSYERAMKNLTVMLTRLNF